RAAAAGVPTAVVRLRDYADRDAFSAAVAERLRDAEVDWVVLAGWLKILTAPMLEAFAGRMINTHPALLPSFGGPGMYGHRVHQAVLDYGCKVPGCTVHLVTEEVDGGPILGQTAVPVAEDDTAETLAARILPHEHRLLVACLRDLAAGKVSLFGRRARIAGREV
ncbi:MAG: phosphoribosylglycinamide formyltransferase, partial [Rubrivivax sp.]|nr:phosphoribosylglycinamide formyltransferase [Rubrivivax sp.]